MNRNQWIFVSIIVLVLVVVGSLILFDNRSSDEPMPSSNLPASNLAYCTDEQVKPCVVSFGIDVNNQLLVNLLLPDLTYPSILLKITSDERTTSYECQRIATAQNNAYCIGENIPPGAVVHMMLISTRNDTILAEGDLTILGLSFPTLEVSTAIPLPTVPPAMPESTATFEFVLPTSTPGQFLTEVPTQVSTQASTQPSYP